MNFIDKSQIMQGIGPDSTADTLEKGINHKYFKREGTPGNYKYYYTEQEYRNAKNLDSYNEAKKICDAYQNYKGDKRSFTYKQLDRAVNDVFMHRMNAMGKQLGLPGYMETYYKEGKIQELQEDKKNLAKEIVERQKSLPKEDIEKKLMEATSIVEYRRHLIDYGTKNGDKDLVEYARNASVSALERRMKSEKVEEQFQDKKQENDELSDKEVDLDEGFSIRVGQELKVPSSLTSDPFGQKGQFGKVISIKDDVITLKFPDGKTGDYDRDIW